MEPAPTPASSPSPPRRKRAAPAPPSLTRRGAATRPPATRPPARRTSTRRSPLRQSELIRRIRAYDAALDTTLLKNAYAYGARKHKAQKRANGEPYFSHPIAVAGILTELRLDAPTIVTALLHDTLEDTTATYEEIENLFGGEIASLVNGVTKLTRLESTSEGAAQAENFRKLLLATAEDVRVLLVKLADRIHNMRTLRHIRPAEKRLRIAQETMDIYAPLAGRMGVQGFREELENHAFAWLNPQAHETLNKRLRRIRAGSGAVVRAITEQLLARLEAESIQAEVSSREKGLYAIWRKMERNSISLEQLCDITGFRIITSDIKECYRILGLVHCAWQTVPGRFKDYISTPKANGYQSIHTTVVGPERQRVELQIRTREMHQVAEYGIAAHWAYKESGASAALDAAVAKQYGWLRQLVELLKSDHTPEEFLEHTKLELFQDQVFCFSPKGLLIALPAGATPLDFAYAVHTEIGDSCVGCRINGRHMPLRTILSSGDEVEIIRSRGQAPMRIWEKMVVTAKARSAIRRALRKHQEEEEVLLGRRILEAVFSQAGKKFRRPLLERALKAVGHESIRALEAAIGRGSADGRQVLRAVYPKARAARSATSRKTAGAPGLPITGIASGMAARVAEGVFPVPGDPIVGIFTRGNGLAIYPMDSPKLRAFDAQPERWSNLEWDADAESDSMFTARAGLVLLDEVGSLSAITSLIADYGANITHLELQRNESNFCDVTMDMEVRDLKHLRRILSALQGLSVIAQLRRIVG